MRLIFLCCFAAILFLNLGCEPKKEPAPPPEAQDFSCIQLFDEQGQTLGIHGSCTNSNDWSNIPLTTSEQEFLNFNDTISLNGTVATPVSQIGIAPNPVKLGGAMFLYVLGISSNPSLKLKIAVVDETLKVVQTVAVRFQGNNNLALFIDPTKLESGKYYRMYYRVSASGTPALFEGYGNFLVCKDYIDGINTTIESDCL
jgi:hypothetical protein